MKTISICELHARTGQMVREAFRYREIRITDRGRVDAGIVPHSRHSKSPTSSAASLRQPSRSWMKAGRPAGAPIAPAPFPRTARSAGVTLYFDTSYLVRLYTHLIRNPLLLDAR